MRESLLKAQEEIPFNNFTWILQQAGKPFPKELGGDCVLQSRRLVEMLRGKGMSAKYLRASGSLHVAVVARSEDELFYLDPFLIQEEPVSITKAMAKEEPEYGEARPKVEGVFSRVSVERFADECIAVSLSRFDPERGRQARVGRGVLYGLQSAVDKLGSGEGLVGGGAPDILALRVLDGDDLLSIKRAALSTGEFEVGTLGKEEYSVSSVDELGGEQEKLVLNIARLVGVEVSALMDAFAETSRILRKIRCVDGKAVR
ncbi:MAG: hypothetical protein NTZ25_02425 [Candidatus Peregrinibacteria bacterium]|nr:hypothetical protein [Candidatus Peregrinibacteria bacterium]